MAPRHRMWLAVLALAVFSVVYCLPGHPSAGDARGWDVLLHVAVFALFGGVLARWAGGGRAWLAGLLLLGAGLEVAQWQLGGLPRLEWRDLADNEVGVLVGWIAASRLRAVLKEQEPRND